MIIFIFVLLAFMLIVVFCGYDAHIRYFPALSPFPGNFHRQLNRIFQHVGLTMVFGSANLIECRHSLLAAYL